VRRDAPLRALVTSDTPQTAMIGRTIGKYRIVGQLGRGGAGIVYKAVDETLGRDVAVKTLNPDLANTDVMSRFRAEATILAKLNHPQIATIFELFRSEGDLLMVMEFVRGETLDKVSERLGAIAPDRAAYLIDLILSALEHAHRAGVVHRDIKPANVMVTDEGGIKIMDFGIARVLGAEQKTIDFRLMGTPAYMSPEQVVGEEVDGRSDLYSVGVLFYRLLTGALPFNADTALGMLQRQIRDNPTPLHEHQPDLPDWCDEIVQRALAKTPADRFQSAEEFRDALNRATGPLPAADFARTFAVAEVPSAALLSPNDTIDLSRQEAVTATAPAKVAAAAAASRRVRTPLASGGMIAAAVVVGVAIGHALVYNTSATRDDSSDGAALPKAIVAVDPVSPTPALVSAPVETSPQPSAPAPAAVEPTPGVEPRPVPPSPASIQKRVPPPAPDPAPAAPPAPLRAAAPVDIVREVPRAEERVETTVPEASLVFETRALVGTRKPKEQSAQLVLGEGKITIIPTSDPSTTLCAIPYRRVISINVSKSRDPLWNSPQGPAPVARAGGTLSKFGIASIREWISLRTSTDEQFVAMRFDEVIIKRVLLALEERTGHKPELVVLPTDDEKKKN
jgi:eukaryotic-like serine/threonine-protein kinase